MRDLRAEGRHEQTGIRKQRPDPLLGRGYLDPLAAGPNALFGSF